MQWAQTEPWVALQKSSEISNAQYRVSIQSVLLAAAFADNSQRGLNWLDALPDADRREKLTSELVKQLSVTDPDQAESLLGRLSAETRTEAELSLWTQRASTDPEGAAAWVVEQDAKLSKSGRALPRTSLLSASSQILMVLGLHGPQSAERFLDALPVAQRETLAPRYVQTLAQSDPLSASRWIEDQSRENRPAMYESLGSAWGQQSLVAAQEFARDMSPGADRDRMLVGLMSGSRLADEDAELLLELISDPETRAQAETNRELRARVMRNF